MAPMLTLMVTWCSFPGVEAGGEELQLPWRQEEKSCSSLRLPTDPLAQAVQEELPRKCHPLGVSAPRGLQLSPWARPNKGCSRCQQVPGNEHSLYRGLPSPTSWRGTQQPLKLILKYVVFTQKAFTAFCSNTCAVWAQDNAERDTGLSRLVHNLKLLAWIFLSKTEKSPDSP